MRFLLLIRRRHCPSNSNRGVLILSPADSYCNGRAQILHDMENPFKYPQNLNPSTFQAPPLPPPPAAPLEIHGTFVSWASAVRYLDLVLDSKLLDAKYSRTPLIRINWDGEPSEYAENQHNWTFL